MRSIKYRGEVDRSTNFAAAFSARASGLVSSQSMYWDSHWFILSFRSLVHALAEALRKTRIEEEILVIPFKSLDTRVRSSRNLLYFLGTYRTPVCDPL